jgi:hypothetical protein
MTLRVPCKGLKWTRSIHSIFMDLIRTPLGQTRGGINEMYKAGHFARFGRSNYLPDEVEAVYEHCKAHGYVLSSVYVSRELPSRGSKTRNYSLPHAASTQHIVLWIYGSRR